MRSLNVAGIFLLLGIATVALMIWQHVGMNIQHNLLADASRTATLFSDRINGGTSAGTVSGSDGDVTLQCNVNHNDFTHAFCGFTLNVAARNQGVDITRFNTLELDVEYETPVNDTLLVYLLNKEYQPEERERANMQPLNILAGKSSYSISVSSFFVPSWWIYQFPRDDLQGQANMKNVTKLRLTTGDNAQSRSVKIVLRSAILSGKAISKTQMYFMVIACWIIVTAFFSIRLLLGLYHSSKAHKAKNLKLHAENSQLYVEKQKLSEVAKTDPLTGVLNRAGLTHAMLMLKLNDIDNSDTHSLIYLDVDHFKKINDNFGHDKGDEVLVALCDMLKASIRHSDLLIRMGGEEFLIICTHTMLGDASQLAEKFRNQIASSIIADIDITCSFGVTECRSSNLQSAIARADKYLYQAKQSGRNQVCSTLA
ncbi:GGDEF domain-containing protein [Salinimonas iocasae]|uniref:diguanylate cyclase n=1 Tax=Salinimonas iocasae TaxID=2572577 RepID=A0A5B7YC76_9ALTE|nr:GGDEF domain-containing protein [Salinimonas iocasae]QCZ92853.1 GGDEF domain-containing protein [Salinimonas iocasae]